MRIHGRLSEIILGSAVLVCILSFMPQIASIETESGMAFYMQSSFFPWICFFALGLLAISLIVNSKKSLHRDFIIERPVQLSGMIVVGILYILLIPVFGYFVLTAVFLLLSFYLLGNRNVFMIAAMTISFLAIAYFAFYKLFNVQFPEGFLF